MPSSYLERGFCEMAEKMAHKANVEYPDTHYRPGHGESLLRELEGKDVIIYDEHHGTSVRIRKATAAAIEYFVDVYSTIIVL